MLSTDTTAALQQQYTAALTDTCQHLQYAAGSRDAYNMPADAYTPLLSYTCLYKPVSGTEKMGLAEVGQLDGRLALPADCPVTTKDRISLTHLNNTLLAAAMLFEVVGQPEVDQFGLIVNLRAVNTGE